MKIDAFCVLKILPDSIESEVIDICDTLIQAKTKLDHACEKYLNDHHLVIQNEKRVHIYKKNVGYLYTNKELICVFDIYLYSIEQEEEK